MARYQNIQVPLTGGIDTKTDPKEVAPPKLTGLENAVFAESRALRKRNGYTDLGTETADATPATLSTDQALMVREDELIRASGGKLYSYASASDTWADRGAYVPTIVEAKVVASETSGQTAADMVEVGGLIVYAWEDSRGGVRYTVVDASTGAAYASDQSLGADAEQPRCVAVDGFAHIMYIEADGGGGYDLKTKRISSANVASSLADPAVTVVAATHATTRTFDAVAYSDAGSESAVFAVQMATGGFRVGFMTAAGAEGSPGTGWPTAITVPVVAKALSVAADPGNAISLVYFTTLSGTQFRVVDPSDLSLLVSGTADATTSPETVRIAQDVSTSGAGYVFDVLYEVEHATDTWRHYVRTCQLSASGATASSVLMRHAGIGSRAFVESGEVYCLLLHASTLQNTYFLVRSDGHIAARILPGIASGLPAGNACPTVLSTASGVHRFAAVYRVRLESEVDESVFSEEGIQEVSFDFDSEKSFRRVQAGQTLYLAGGYLAQYDGEGAVEVGFHLFAENVTGASETDGAGTGLNPSSTSGQVHTYSVYPEWVNARGEREQGTQAASVAVTVSNAAHNAIRITIPTLSFTAKTGARSEVSWAVYRTEANQTTRYRVSSLDPSATGDNGYVANDRTVDTVEFLDKMTDASLISKELDYQNAELDHVAPPACSVVAAGRDRVFVSGTREESRIYASKLRRSGRIAAFNDTSSLVLDIDGDGGAITALAVMGEALVVFKRDRIFALAGEGPNDLGSGGGFSRAERVPGDVGCRNPRSVVQIPQGIIFESEKGLWLLGRDFSLSYVGADVEAYNSQRVTSATVLRDKNLAVFLKSNGITVAYDYLVQAWTTWPPVTGVDGTVWQSKHCYAVGDGSVRKETEGHFRDGETPFRLVIETAWLKPGNDRLWKARRALFRGENRSTHTLRVSMGWNYQAYSRSRDWDPSSALASETYGDDSPYGETGTVYGTAADELYLPRFRLPRQKCLAVRFKIEDIPGDNPGESYELSALTLEVAARESGGKVLPPAKSVG